MNYTNLDLSRFLKYDSKIGDDSGADMYWVNSFEEGRKDSMVSSWKLQKEKPANNKVRYYPAFSEEYFKEKILPKLLK